MKKQILSAINIVFWTLVGCQTTSESDKLVSSEGLLNVENDKSYSSDILSNIDSNTVEVIKLPRPNSETFSFEEAENRKGEIYSMQLTPKYFEWKNPTTGGAVHINKQDEIEVYQFTSGYMYLGKNVRQNGDTCVIVALAPKDTSFVVIKDELKHHVGGDGYGRAASVLITSEYDLNKSKSLGLIMDELFEPGTQLYYLKRK